MFDQSTFGKRPLHKSALLGMYIGASLVEEIAHATLRDLVVVKVGLHKVGVNTVDDFHSWEIRDGDFLGRDAHDGAIPLM